MSSVNAWSIPPLALAAVNLYVAAHSAVIFLRTRRSRELLAFASLAVAIGLYDVCSAFLYNAGSPAGGRTWQLAQFAALTLGSLALLIFVADYSGRRIGKLLTVLGSAAALIWCAVAVTGGEALIRRVPAVKHVALPGGLQVTYQEAQTGPLAIPLELLGFAVFGYAFWAALALRRSGRRQRGTHLLAATAVLFAAAVNDAAVGLGLLQSIYLVEYAFLAMVVLMADAISRELVDAGRAQAALARSEERFRSMVQQSYDLITVIDAETTITYATPSAERILGRRPGDLVGRGAFEIVHPEDVPGVREAFERTAAGRGRGEPIEFRVRHADGSWVDLEGIGSTQLAHPEIRGVVLNSRDVSERRHAEAAIRRTLRELEVLGAVGQVAVGADDEDELIERTTEIVREALYPDDCGVLLVDAAAGALRYTASYRVASPAVARTPIPLGVGITGTVAATGRALRVDAAARDPRYLVREPGLCSELCVPLLLGSEVIGVINAESRTLAAFTADDERVLTTVAGQIATALGRLRAAAAHRESEERFRRLAESAFEGIGIHDEGRIVDVNLRLAEMLGFEPDELVGRHVMELVAPASAAEVDSSLRAGRDEVYEHLAVRKDGTTFPVETQGKPLSASQPKLRVAAVRDITERREAEKRIRRQLERLAALRAIDSAIAAGRELDATMGVVLEQAVAQLGVDAALVLRVDGNGEVLIPVAWQGFPAGAPHGRVMFGECRSGRAAQQRELISEPGPGGSCRACRALVAEGFQCGFAAPLVVKDTVYGVLEVFCRTPHQADGEWLDFLETLAGQLAIAIDGHLLLDQLERSNSNLARAYDTTLEGWSRALELRDRETQGHSARVVELTLKVAQAMGIEEDELDDMRRGALLHDIGKMAIPDRILLKPGPLTEEEWEVMRSHPVLAHDLLQPIEYLRSALDIPFSHHERWDGSGYPRGLVGEEIPVAARIFAVVDAWDGLSHRRPYRAAWPAERVREHLRQLAGRHFDPRVVAAFLGLVAG